MGTLKSNLTIFLTIVGCNIAAQPDIGRVYDLNESTNESSFWIEQKSKDFEVFPKRRKRQKSSSKMKRHNRSMSKKFKKKNDDSLRDKLQ